MGRLSCQRLELSLAGPTVIATPVLARSCHFMLDFLVVTFALFCFVSCVYMLHIVNMLLFARYFIWFVTLRVHSTPVFACLHCLLNRAPATRRAGASVAIYNLLLLFLAFRELSLMGTACSTRGILHFWAWLRYYILIMCFAAAD